jgi:uncharacterized membrane protein
MVQFGQLLVILGLGSFVLHLMQMEFRLLMWVDLWGVATGNIIRISMVVVGVLLFIVGSRAAKAQSVESFDDIKTKE